MSSYVLKGKAIWISKEPAPTGLAITAVTKAAECEITVTNTASPGDIIRVEGTGFSSLDGKAFEVKSASLTAVVIDFDTTAETGTFTTGGKAYIYDAETGLVCVCLNSFGVNREAAATITAATFCGTDTLAGQPGAVTFEFAGFDDPESAGLAELIKAQMDGKPRVMVYVYPASASSTGKSYKLILPSVVVSGLNGPVATADGAATFSGTGTVNGTPTYTNL
jgi:hypothetical protein